MEKQMKRISIRSAMLAACLIASQVVLAAQPAKGPKKPAPPPKPPKPGVTSFTGPVKKAPIGKTFVLAVPRKGDVTVDASKAKVRVNGKFASFDVIKAGVMVTARGTMNGATLAASDVEAHPRGGSKPPPPAPKPPSPPKKK
jgi:hypothetical protein